LIVPLPKNTREDIQEPFVREQQIDPKKYYPKGYHPELLEEWPVESDLVVPFEDMPPALKKSMSDRWSQKVRNQKILEEQAK
jgi:ribonuclease Z